MNTSKPKGGKWKNGGVPDADARGGDPTDLTAILYQPSTSGPFERHRTYQITDPSARIDDGHGACGMFRALLVMLAKVGFAGQTGLLQEQLLLTQHQFTRAAGLFTPRSGLHRSSRSTERNWPRPKQ